MKACYVETAKKLLSKREELIRLSEALDNEFEDANGYVEFKGWRKELRFFFQEDELCDLVKARVRLLLGENMKELTDLGVEL